MLGVCALWWIKTLHQGLYSPYPVHIQHSLEPPEGRSCPQVSLGSLTHWELLGLIVPGLLGTRPKGWEAPSSSHPCCHPWKMLQDTLLLLSPTSPALPCVSSSFPPHQVPVAWSLFLNFECPWAASSLHFLRTWGVTEEPTLGTFLSFLFSNWILLVYSF